MTGTPEAERERAIEPEAGLGHDYDGPELRSGTPEYEAEYAEYLAWAGQAEPEPEDRPVPYTLTPRAEAVCASWDAHLKAEPEPEAHVIDCAYVRFEPSAYDLGITDDPEPEPEAEL